MLKLGLRCIRVRIFERSNYDKQLGYSARSGVSVAKILTRMKGESDSSCAMRGPQKIAKLKRM